MTVCNQAEGKQDDIDNHIKGSERNRNQFVKSAHKRLERIDSKCGYFENTDTDGTDDNTEQGHKNSSCFHGNLLI